MKQGFRRLLGMIGLMGAFAERATQTNYTEENTIRNSANSFGMHNPIYIPSKSQRVKSRRLAKRNANR